MLTEQLSQLKSVSKDIVMCYPILINKKIVRKESSTPFNINVNTVSL